MAQKITVTLEDDLDGGPADQTVRFGLDGAEYEIDLWRVNSASVDGCVGRLHAVLCPCVFGLAGRDSLRAVSYSVVGVHAAVAGCRRSWSSVLLPRAGR